MKALIVCLLFLAGCGPLVIPAGEPATSPHLDEGDLIARDGARLPMRHWPAEGDIRGIVIALHGYTDYSAAFERIGPWLAGLGYDTFAYDQRGFGMAPHPRIWPGSQTLIDDLGDAIAAVRRQSGNSTLPLFLVGESMGGSVAMAAAAGMDDDHLAGLVLTAPGVREDLPYRSLWDAIFWSAAHVAPGFTVTVSRDADGSLMDAAAGRLRDDPLVIQDIRADSYYGVVRLADRASLAAAEIDIPVLMLHGGEDTLIRRVSILAAYESLPGDKTLLLYPGAPHLLLHWKEQDRVLEDIGRWFDARQAEHAPANGDGRALSPR